MATLDYLSSVPQPRLIVNAGIHLLAWSIVFFFIAGLLAAQAVYFAFVMAGECSRWELLELFTLVLMLYGTITLLVVLLGLRCNKARKGLLRAELYDLGWTIKLFRIIYLLSGTGLIVSLVTLIRNFDSSGFQVAGVFASGFVMLTFLTGWTRHRLGKALIHLRSLSQLSSQPL